ncbi:hypothetical protein [Peterkaempfera sp. SMS 1(5)a]|uniref:hypothetical protein n=1 Tax=Peterkaempfera podocarpi TaxID=3232308 RepID=UPI00366D8D0E
MSAPDPHDPYELRARVLRLMAARIRQFAAELDMCAAAARATGGMRRFAAAMAAGEARDVAQHPDLAELNVQMDGYYGGPA